jgi:hypothetical protein
MAVDNAWRNAIEPHGQREAEKTTYHRDGISPPRYNDGLGKAGDGQQVAAGKRNGIGRVLSWQPIAGSLDGHQNHAERHEAS